MSFSSRPSRERGPRRLSWLSFLDFKIKKQSEMQQARGLLQKFFHLRIVHISLGIIAVLILAPFIFFYFNKPIVQPNINYGITFSNRYASDLGLDWKDTYIKILDDMKVKNLRLVAYWTDIEKQRDIYDYSDLQWQVDEAQKRHVNIILTVGKKVPRWPECFEPEWWKAIDDKDVQEVELVDFVKQTVNRFKGYDTIKMWQIENEPFFPFGSCTPFRESTLEKEVALVRSIDSRLILIQDSGEGGFWFRTYSLGDYLGISMYRKIWYDFWGIFLGRSIYFQYPLANWSYKIKAAVLGIPYDHVIVTELQAEPWGPDINSALTEEEKDKTMSTNDFLSTMSYAQSAGFKDLYLWGAEWWLWEKQVNNNPFYWDTAKALFASSRGH